MQHSKSISLIEYWDELRVNSAMPYLLDIKLGALSDKMRNSLFILDATNLLRPAYKFAGTNVCGHFAKPTSPYLNTGLRDTNFLAQWRDDEKPTLLHYMKYAMEKVCQPVYLAYGGVSNNAFFEFETVLAPIYYDNLRPSGFVGTTNIIRASRIGVGSTYSESPVMELRLQLHSPQMVDERTPIGLYDIPPARRVDAPIPRPTERVLRLVS